MTDLDARIAMVEECLEYADRDGMSEDDLTELVTELIELHAQREQEARTPHPPHPIRTQRPPSGEDDDEDPNETQADLRMLATSFGFRITDEI